MTEKKLRESEDTAAKPGKESYEAPKVESVQLSKEAAEALT